jgi:hypothetical protein
MLGSTAHYVRLNTACEVLKPVGQTEVGPKKRARTVQSAGCVKCPPYSEIARPVAG